MEIKKLEALKIFISKELKGNMEFVSIIRALCPDKIISLNQDGSLVFSDVSIMQADHIIYEAFCKWIEINSELIKEDMKSFLNNFPIYKNYLNINDVYNVKNDTTAGRIKLLYKRYIMNNLILIIFE